MKKERTLQEVIITPQMAAEIIENRNTHNRPVRKATIQRYANDMISGGWKEGVGQPIIFDWNRILIDGQHRLMALIKANRSIMFSVIEGLDPEMFDVIDRGVPRNASDTLAVDGVKNSTTVAAVIKLSILINNTMPIRRQGRDAKIINNTLIKETYHSNPNYWDEVGMLAVRCYREIKKQGRPVIEGGQIGFWYHIFYQISPSMAFNFWDRFVNGNRGGDTGPDKLFEALNRDVNSEKRMTNYYRYAIIIKAWNKYLRGIPVKKLVFNPGRENFPILDRGERISI